MDIMKGKWNKNAVLKAVERCRSLANKLSREEKNKRAEVVAPEGCFAVYVGPERERFVVRTEFANHPLFKMLLDDAVMEYGYDSPGPILIPCDVDLFYRVFLDIKNGSGDDEEEDRMSRYGGCGYGAVFCMSPSGRDDKGYRRMFKFNGFL